MHAVLVGQLQRVVQQPLDMVCVHAGGTETLRGSCLRPWEMRGMHACQQHQAIQPPLHFCAVDAIVRHSILLNVRQDATKQQGRCGSRVQGGAAHHSGKGGGVGREARVRCRARRTACQTCADLNRGLRTVPTRLRWERMCFHFSVRARPQQIQAQYTQELRDRQARTAPKHVCCSATRIVL